MIASWLLICLTKIYMYILAEDNFETSMITEALMQEQVSVTDFSLSLLLVITDLLKQHIENSEMFITISKLFRKLSDLLVLDDFIAVWKIDDLHSKRRVRFFNL